MHWKFWKRETVEKEHRNTWSNWSDPYGVEADATDL